MEWWVRQEKFVVQGRWSQRSRHMAAISFIIEILIFELFNK
jgi:hypothetical protein